MESWQIAAISVSYSTEAYLLNNIASDCKYSVFKVHKRLRHFFFPYTIMTVGEFPPSLLIVAVLYTTCFPQRCQPSVHKAMCVFPPRSSCIRFFYSLCFYLCGAGFEWAMKSFQYSELVQFSQRPKFTITNIVLIFHSNFIILPLVKLTTSISSRPASIIAATPPQIEV